MKDKVKRKRIINTRKIQSILNDNSFVSESHKNYELEKQQKLVEDKQRDVDYIVELQLKLQLVKRKTKQLNSDFIKENFKKFTSIIEFFKTYNNVKKKRKNVIRSIKKELKLAKKNYIYKYETSSFKMRRWFFGMGKEFNRITWSSKKDVLINLLVVISISGFLAIVFFIIDMICSII